MIILSNEIMVLSNIFLICNGKEFALIQRYTIKKLYSNYFTRSKYYELLKNPLDSFFVLENKPSQFDLISMENIMKHRVIFGKII